MTHLQWPDLPDSNSKQDLTANASPTQLKADTKSSPQQELGKTYASKKIQVASLAMRTSSIGSMAGSMSPLFPTKSGMAQQPFQQVTLSLSDGPEKKSRFGSPDHDRALLDKTWSVLAPKLESNQQQRATQSRRRRRVTFNDVIEFFEPPPPYDDDNDGTKLGDLIDDNKSQGLEEKNSDGCTNYGSTFLPMEPQSVNALSSPSADIQASPLHHTNSNNNIITDIPFSSTESQTSTSSLSSVSTTSTSSSLSSSSIEYSSNKINALRSSFFKQNVNASTCSLPMPQASSSVVSLVPTTSSSSATSQSASPLVFRRKGTKVSKNAILDILEKRSHHHTPSLRRMPVKRLSSTQAPPGFHKTLDAVQNEIKQAIERAKTPTVDGQKQQQQKYEDQTNGKQTEASISHQQQDSASSLSDDTYSSTTTLADAAPVDDSEDNDHKSQMENNNAGSSPKQLNLPEYGNNYGMTTGLDTAPYDTATDDFGEIVLQELDKIACDDSVRSSEVSKPVNDEMSTQQNKWVKENNDHQLVHSSRIWHLLDHPEDATLSTKESILRNTNHIDLNTVKSGRLYLKVIAAENLDFPIDNDAPSIRCSVINGNDHFESGYYSMQHDIHFNHEFILDDVIPDTELTLTLQANQPSDTNTRRWSKRTSWADRKPISGDLTRYIHAEDRSLAQTRISLPSIAFQCQTTLCTASFALVNGWYRPARKLTSSSSRRTVVQEKAVGKITIELFYLPNVHPQMTNLPTNMDGCENALNIQQFHQRVWQCGYMYQLGGDIKFWRRRYFKLTGSKLYSYTDTVHSPRSWIDLSQAVELVCDHRVLVDRKINSSSNVQDPEADVMSLMTALETYSDDSNSRNNDLSVSFDDSTLSLSTSATSFNLDTFNNKDDDDHHGDDDDNISCYSVKNGFHLKFSNGDKIDFFCDSNDKRDQWLHVLKLILGRIPSLPAWLPI
ncbi:hypothetical protein BCR42DRAFT_417205 [Absidia repens]|uniref:PH domain-containing protein n=1 Tax=Absidia repens TaxID=90262 RepID=A0A1X2IDI2_9FUNG|nr:hypothetical protein BCR42DRAFT_417205 [Absidia repens]